MATKNLFSQISNLNKFIINQDTIVAQHKENVLEFDKNDQLISKYESEVRISVILCVLSVLNISILATLIITISETIKNELKIIPTEIPNISKMPHLQAIFKNGSVYSSEYKNRTFSKLKHEFDLPMAADFYFPFEYKEKMSYIHGNGLNKHILQTFRNIHGHKRQKKHTFSKKEEIDSNTSLLYVKQGLGKENLGFNNSILQIGPYLMIFGGGHNQYGNRDIFSAFKDYH